MSVCLNCMREFKAGKNEQGKFCSHQCFCAYEHSRKSVNGMGVGRINSKANWSIKNKDKVFERNFVNSNNLVKRNLGEILDEMDIYVRSPKERSKVIWNNELNDLTIQKLNEVIALCKAKKLEYGIV